MSTEDLLLAYWPDTVTISDQSRPLVVSSVKLGRTITGGADAYYDDFNSALQALASQDQCKGGSADIIAFDEDDWMAKNEDLNIVDWNSAITTNLKSGIVRIEKNPFIQEEQTFEWRKI
jgi:hypothetical protein